ncbi:LapA family protein [Magnetofaba australis]|uniref:Lipopolysaccharide assembly protein A domain-containing protein n=1 Tax=Magnetofaba australis IT-1 TaxID=1434232 RepID=A0A1Y2JZH9_9PROT|nr:LapA family protein [Magnetofaba australis]OSM00279.1 hypothetical protein MAIT1_00761 [Magnetofaba australis IT-1]
MSRSWLNPLVLTLLLLLAARAVLGDGAQAVVRLSAHDPGFAAPLWGLVFAIALCGFLLGAAVTWAAGRRQRQRYAEACRRCELLERELTSLRNLPLDAPAERP